MSAPRIEIDMGMLTRYMEWKPTLADTAAFFECSEDTIERRIREKTDLSFAAFRDKSMHTTRKKLVDRALDRALSGSDTMLIFCLKNLCEWADKPQDKETAAQTSADDARILAEVVKTLREIK